MRVSIERGELGLSPTGINSLYFPLNQQIFNDEMSKLQARERVIRVVHKINTQILILSKLDAKYLKRMLF